MPAEQHSTVVVDRDDSLATICGKLDSTRLTRIAVLVPRGNSELSRAIGMRLVMRHADLTGKDIVIASRSQSVRQRARAEGQASSSSERRVRFEARGAGLQLGGLDLPLPGRTALATLLVLGAFVALAYAAMFWYLPVATLTVYVPATAVMTEQLVSVDAQANHLNSSGLVVPATRRQASVFRTVFIPASGAPSADQSSGQASAGKTVADGDLKAAQDLAPAALREQALAELSARYGSTQTLFPQTALVQVLSVQSREKAGNAADFLEVAYHGSVTVMSVRTDDLQQLFTERLRQDLGRDRQLLDSSLVVSTVKSGPYEAGSEKLPVQFRAQASSAVSLDTSRLRLGLRGRSRRDALKTLDRQLSPPRPSELRLSPDWLPWLPRTAGHIHLQLRADGAPG